ncbi:histone-lysine N-methyltransferase SETMAR [Plakobranchus ocellatus]|uniref:Carbonic anhydrase n=1 Tax=Plakobranchus ocellatus TaxID=259542 RepID=A0AAV4DJM8_9GAST|nr:histone-lysine N-methyltransferase SETMAR [Plakobranchus ocellatus]
MYSVDGRGVVPIGILNLGATVSLKPKIRNIIFEGGELPGKFLLYNIHFHWGNRDLAGSEHRLDGRAFPLEMHLVTYNTKYRDMVEAAGMEDGIHVAAIVFERSWRANTGLSFCINKLRRVRNPGLQTDGGMFNISSLLPSPNVPYYRYRGSLTTPPCTGNVLWSVYSSPLTISGRQLAQFRLLHLNTVANRYFGGNSRPVQPLNNRLIITNNPLFSK